MERFGPTRRGGPVFRWLGEPLAIDLANTVMVVRPGEAVDLLSSSKELEQWLDLERPRLGDCEFAPRHLEEIKRVRGEIRKALEAVATGNEPPWEALEALNAASSAAPVAPQLRVGDDGSSVIEEPEEVDDLPTLLGVLARSAIRVLAECGRRPLHVCDAPSCGMFFVGRRRWCCAACGNRARAARYYRRHSATQS